MIMLDVPYLSQLEQFDTRGWNNCGPASLVMLLAYDGLVAADDATLHHVADYVRNGYFDGDWWANSFTDFPLMRDLVRREYGRESVMLRTWPAVYAALDAGRPVIMLARDTYFQPRQFPTGPGWDANHFIVLRGYDDTNLYVCDPLAYWHRGPGFYTRASVARAVSAVGGVYALQLVAPPPPPAPEPTPPLDPTTITPEERVMFSDEEIAAVVQAEITNANRPVSFNAETGIIKAWIAAYREGRYLGLPMTEEAQTDDGALIYRRFDTGLVIYRPSDGVCSSKG